MKAYFLTQVRFNFQDTKKQSSPPATKPRTNWLKTERDKPVASLATPPIDEDKKIKKPKIAKIITVNKKILSVFFLI
jgi:hypothetical protein